MRTLKLIAIWTSPIWALPALIVYVIMIIPVAIAELIVCEVHNLILPEDLTWYPRLMD